MNTSSIATTMGSILLNSTSNETIKKSPTPKQIMIFDTTYHYFWLSVALFVFIVNIFVLYVFKSDAKLLRGMPANNLLLSLAMNDLLSGFTSLLQVFPYIEYHIFETRVLFSLGYRIALDVSITMLSLTSVIHLCLLAAERYLSIFFALQFKSMVTTRRVRYCILTAWLTSCCIALLQFTWVWPLLRGNVSMQRRRNIQKIDTYFSAIVIVAFAFTPLIILVIAYARMIIMCKKLIRQAPDNLLVRRNTLHKEIKILLMYFIMFTIFLFLCVPFFSIRLLVDICTMTAKRIDLKKEMIEAFVLMRYLVSAVNPFIYTFYKQDFRRTIKSLFVIARLRGLPSYLTRQSNLEDGNESVTKELFTSTTTPASTRPDIELQHTTVSGKRLLLPRKISTQRTVNHRQIITSYV